MKRTFLALCVSLALQQGYAQDISKGHTFADGDTVHAADLNTLVDSATILETFMSNKATASPLPTDLFIFDQASTSTLKTVSLANLLSAGSAVVTTSTRAANTFLGGPATGSAAAPTFRALAPADTANATSTSGGTTIDCSLARTFSRTLAANTTYTFSNIPDGGTFTVAIKQAASGGPYTATFTAVAWRGGVTPTQTTTANHVDLYTFIRFGSALYGSASQNY